MSVSLNNHSRPVQTRHTTSAGGTRAMTAASLSPIRFGIAAEESPAPKKAPSSGIGKFFSDMWNQFVNFVKGVGNQIAKLFGFGKKDEAATQAQVNAEVRGGENPNEAWTSTPIQEANDIPTASAPHQPPNEQTIIPERIIDLSGRDLTQAFTVYSGEKPDLSGANLKDANLEGWLAYGTYKGADFTGANLSNTNTLAFDPADFEEANLTGADLSDSEFRDTNFQNANFSGATMENVYFDHANLTGAQFTGADLSGAVFNGTDLTGADFTGANLEGATFEKVTYS